VRTLRGAASPPRAVLLQLRHRRGGGDVSEGLNWPDALVLSVFIVSMFAVLAWVVWLAYRDERDKP
jgi:hypothetical protein